MKLPALRTLEASREMLDVFLGLNLDGRIGQGEFSAMRNLSSDSYPLLSPRGRRGVYCRPRSAQGMIGRDSLCYVDGSRFVMDGYEVELNLSQRPEDCPKRLVSMGAYVVIFPDKVYVNTADVSDHGFLEARWAAADAVGYTPADIEGNIRLPDYVQDAEPSQPGNMQLWMDTASHSLMQWSASSAMWTPVAASYVRIDAPGIGAAFRQFDGVELAGLPDALGDLEGSTVIWAREDDWILVPGLLDSRVDAAGGLTVQRLLPEMDFVIESGNRLWGCRYGPDRKGKIVNEIYASKLGDFRNWSCFMGLSTDSYTVSLGEDGVFTGAVTHMGYPLFFREGCLHKVYGNYPANYRLQTTPCRGVQRGSSESLAILNEVLFYKSTHGICAYDGSLPVEVSHDLGTEPYTDAAAGAFRHKYYISMRNAGGEYRLFVFDSLRKLWHMEDELQVRRFAACRQELYALDGDGVIRTLAGSGEQDPEPIEWMAQTGDLGIGSPDSKYLARLVLRMDLEPESQVRVLVNYDASPLWEQAAVLRGSGLGSFTVPIAVRRCDHLRLRLEGTGAARLHAITKTMESGSDVF